MKAVFGFQETQRAMRTLQSTLERRCGNAMKQAALLIEREAKRNIAYGRTDWPALSPATLKRRKDNKPLYDTGTLLRSIHSEIEEQRAVIGSDRDYAPVHEFGTTTAGRSKNVAIPKRPYLEPAFVENYKQIKEIFVQKIRGH